MNKKGMLQWAAFLIFLGILLLISVFGGFGAVYSLFKGLTSIPPIVILGLSVLIIMLLLKGGGKR